ncbi:MAG: TonB-dependent receptor [Betaproteobacteria bacterium HGW-Betaproteobacteria-1]|jgi:iron complex outermembrane receptor protein|nr:MAG: TonB-dependent receptor [Betaproteobacteria bacterium HGW-Betaproteobacteria-1]
MSSINTRARLPARKALFLAVAFAVSHSFLFALNAKADSDTIELAPVPVTANPLGAGSDEMVVPVSVLSGRELSLGRESTLGDTLKSLPGVSATSFGPNASRPVIRGLDSERVRIMQNGVGILDASSLSFDHAVGIDPLIIEQIDVVRGPAALLYGGSAIGGVVNAIDHRIPKEQLDGITGRGEVRFGGAEDQKSGAIVLDAGNGLFAIHADVYERKTNDMDIPGYAVSSRKNREDGTPREHRGRLVNSASRADGGALGASLTFDNGYVGLSYSGHDNKYGVVAEEDVIINQSTDRWDLATEFKDLGNIINRVKFRFANTDYKHVEIADGSPETRFSNRGNEGSLEIGHGNIGKLSGAVGFQFQDSKFAAIGDEAFVPKNQTQSRGVYVYEELPISLTNADDLKLSLGGRVDRVEVDSEGGGRFGTAVSRDFTPKSISAGALLKINEQWAVSGNLSSNQRAPSYFELYANGPHVATGQYEVGNTDFDIERSRGIDAQIRWKSGKHAFNVGAYHTRFSNFIGLFSNGLMFDEDGVIDPAGELAGADFEQVKATFSGLEADGKFRIYEGRGTLDLTMRGDYVRARNRDAGEYLPRISPLRLGWGLNYSFNRFGTSLDVLHGFKQTKVADNELPTDSYTSVNATATWLLPTTMRLEAFAKAYNLLDDEIRDHTSFLKDIAPQRSRSLLIGLRGEF